MADLLIRIRDKPTSGDAETDELQFKRGDVIAIWPTPGPWGSAELTNPDWRILRLPNVSVTDAEELIKPELLELATNTRLMRKRKAKCNVDSTNWPNPVRNWLVNDSRNQPIFTSNISLETFLSFIENKTPRQQVRIL